MPRSRTARSINVSHKDSRLSSTADIDEFYLLKEFFGSGIIRVSLEIFELEIDKSKDSKDGSFLFPF